MNLLRPDIIAHWEEAGRQWLRLTTAERDRNGRFATDAWQQLSEARLFALLDQDEGGVAEAHARMASALYGLAKGSLDLPFSASVAAHLSIASDLLQTFGTREQIHRYLPDMKKGLRIGAICNAEEGSGSDLRLMRSTAAPGPDGLVRVEAHKPCSTNLSIAGLAFVSCFSGEQIRVFLLESGEFEQGALQGELSSFRTGAVGFLKAEALLSSAEREIRDGLRALRHCFHTERFYLGVLVAGLLAGLEQSTGGRVIARKHTAQRQYLQEKLVGLRVARAKVEALVGQVFSLAGNGSHWEAAAVELSVLKLVLNTEALQAAQGAYQSIGFEAVFQRDDAQRIARDLQALSYFGGTTELQKLQIFQELSRAETERARGRKAA